MQVLLETERMVLRRFTEADVDHLSSFSYCTADSIVDQSRIKRRRAAGGCLNC